MALAHGHKLSEKVIGLAIDVHRTLGPGLLESVYEHCLCWELAQSGIAHARQVTVPVPYKRIKLKCGYRMDILVEDTLIIEIKSADKIIPIHEAQLLTYLRLSRRPIGLPINFNTLMLKDSIRRVVL